MSYSRSTFACEAEPSPLTTAPAREMSATSPVIPIEIKFDPALYGRERNTRRAATKAFFEEQPLEHPTQDCMKSRKRAHSPDSCGETRRRRTAETLASLEIPTHQISLRTGPPSVPCFDDGFVAGKSRLSPVRELQLSRSALATRDFEPRTPISIESSPPQSLSSGIVNWQTEATSAPFTSSDRLDRAVAQSRDFVELVKESLRQKSQQVPENVSSNDARHILTLLERASTPADHEAAWLSTAEAKEFLRPSYFHNFPMITQNQQALPLQTVEDFLQEFYDDNTLISIQDSSAGVGQMQPSVRQVKIGVVKNRFAEKHKSPALAPWNLLELATHHEDGLRPSFLDSEECRLLTKIKIPEVVPAGKRRAYDLGYKEVERWALLAEPGALTAPHQDSHGLNTFITLNQGRIGFGWLSNPSTAERQAWLTNPQCFTGGSWRYVVLTEGQTVYFPAGTVHFVFRLPSDGPTLAFGGHSLRCSTIVHWAQSLIEEKSNPSVTNEDLTRSAKDRLERVTKFVKASLMKGPAATNRWGGEESISEFLRLKELFQTMTKKR